ncbi:MAG: PDZ domain-containing protein [Verrucomicrobia bacterium]|nr:PDZ domain-containing protein [Verrucomicrobiota bacterium]
MSPNWSPYRMLVAVIATGVGAVGARAIELPTAFMEGLKSEQFAERAAAEAELLAWTRQRPEAAMEELYQQSRTAGEPEVRERCLSVLRDLLTDEYLRDGVGYMGILMNPMTELVNIAGAAKPRFAIRILQVVPDSPAQKSGLLMGDLMLGVDAAVWQQDDTSEVVSKKIKSFKAGTQVSIKLFRNGNIVDVPLVLARRPAAADLQQLQFGPGMQISPEAAAAAERAAKEEYFRRWLAERKSRD